MNFLQSFHERAQQAVTAAKGLATSVSHDAYDSIKVVADTVAADVRGVAEDARKKVTRLHSDRTDSCGPTDSHAGVNEHVINFVRTLTCASFQAHEGVDKGDYKPLEPWQVEHAQAVLQQCKELENLRFVLCPRRMSEPQFWTIYFHLVDGLLEQPSNSDPGGSGQQTSCGFSAWENVDSETANRSATPAGNAEDDLDVYLRDMLDGDEEAGHVSGEHAEDLDQYLEELAASSSDGGPADRQADDASDNDLAAYLGDLGVGEGHDHSPQDSGKTA